LLLMDDWLHQRAKEMRCAPVLYERRLWKVLRDRRLEGLKFRRQDAFLREQNFHVLRFPNSQIENRSHEVIAAILATVTP